MNLEFITAIFFLLGFVVFYNTKMLHRQPLQNNQTLSVIIPARNEAINLPSLLSRLNQEKQFIYEIIVVNDGSKDNTENIAKAFGAKVLNVDGYPKDWKGKNFACFTGAKQALGERLLFLDADLLPQENMVQKLHSNYRGGTVLSVQPYHYTEKFYEQLSLFFNMITIGAVGVSLPGKDKSIGLFGPVIMMDKSLYFDFGGHELVKNEVIEDYHLGMLLRKKAIACDLFLGYGSISYQMYKGGISDLIWGWSKNFAGAAIKTPFPHLLCVSLWIMSYYFIALNLIQNSILYYNGTQDIQFTLLYLGLYLFAGTVLYIKARTLGKFSLLSCIFYIIPLSAFTVIFALSFVLKFIVKKVRWKGRWLKI